MRKPLLSLETKIKIMLWKSYFDYGYSYFNYVKPFFYLFVGNDIFINKSFTSFWMSIVIGGALCFLIGWGYYKSDFVRAATEVGNRYNLFVQEMRERFKYNPKK